MIFCTNDKIFTNGISLLQLYFHEKGTCITGAFPTSGG